MHTTDVTTLKDCMVAPSASECTGTYGDPPNLNNLAYTMSKCMNDHTAEDCTSVYPAATTLPKVTKSVSVIMAYYQTVCQVLIYYHNNNFRL